jgi:hypothetical protein
LREKPVCTWVWRGTRQGAAACRKVRNAGPAFANARASHAGLRRLLGWSRPMSSRDDDRFRVRPGAPKQLGDAFINKVLRQTNKAGAKLARRPCGRADRCDTNRQRRYPKGCRSGAVAATRKRPRPAQRGRWQRSQPARCERADANETRHGDRSGISGHGSTLPASQAACRSAV